MAELPLPGDLCQWHMDNGWFFCRVAARAQGDNVNRGGRVSRKPTRAAETDEMQILSFARRAVTQAQRRENGGDKVWVKVSPTGELEKPDGEVPKPLGFGEPKPRCQHNPQKPPEHPFYTPAPVPKTCSTDALRAKVIPSKTNGKQKVGKFSKMLRG
jgi:hypothetical protein